jgi:hypothetical protein
VRGVVPFTEARKGANNEFAGRKWKIRMRMCMVSRGVLVVSLREARAEASEEKTMIEKATWVREK